MFRCTIGIYRAFQRVCARTSPRWWAVDGGGADDSDDGGAKMRTVADSTGRVWTIFEVKKQGGPSEQWTYLPEQFGNGWLCFESDASKRRLTPVPPHWAEYGDEQLAALLEKAEPVVRPRVNAEEQSRAE